MIVIWGQWSLEKSVIVFNGRTSGLHSNSDVVLVLNVKLYIPSVAVIVICYIFFDFVNSGNCSSLALCYMTSFSQLTFVELTVLCNNKNLCVIFLHSFIFTH